MSKDHVRAAMCEGKRRYPTWTAAAVVTRNMKRHRKSDTNIFRCPFCHSFHIGHDSK